MAKIALKPIAFAGLLVAFSLGSASYSVSSSFTDQEIAHRIYHELQEAIGDKGANWPKLIVWSIENRGAVFVPGANSIYLDEKLIRSCKKFGDQMEDALSFVIAHEMTHFYQSHQWKESGLVHNFMISAETFAVHRQQEAQADIYGAFISYQAGYNTLSLIPDLLDRIYEAYQLDTSANIQYPSLQQRKDLALESCELAGNLIEIYQMANYLLVLGRFDAAYHLYKYIEQKIQFKELHYNLGICNMMAYLNLKKIDLKYSLSIDSRAPIVRGLIERSPEELLSEAMASFERITKEYDPEYGPAIIQLISLFDWSGKIDKAQEIVTRCEAKSEIRESILYQLTKANFYTRQDKIEKSQALYQSILDSAPSEWFFLRDLIEYNLAVLQGETLQGVDRQNHPIRNQNGLDGVSSILFYQDFQHSIAIRSDLLFHSGQEYNSIVSRLEFGKSKFTMQRFTSPEIETSGGLGIGHPFEEIESLFSDDLCTTWQDVQGSYVIVFEKGLIFKLNKKGIITEWVSFST